MAALPLAPVALDLVCDLERSLFALTVSWISLSVFLYSKSYMAHDKHLPRFAATLFGFVMSMLILIFSPNLFTVMLG